LTGFPAELPSSSSQASRRPVIQSRSARPAPVLIAAVAGAAAGTVIACGAMAAVIARRPVVSAARAAKYARMLDELAHAEQAAPRRDRRRAVCAEFPGSVHAARSGLAGGCEGPQRSLGLLRVEGPEPLALPTRQDLAASLRPCDGQARDDFAAARETLAALRVRLGGYPRPGPARPGRSDLR